MTALQQRAAHVANALAGVQAQQQLNQWAAAAVRDLVQRAAA